MDWFRFYNIYLCVIINIGTYFTTLKFYTICATEKYVMKHKNYIMHTYAHHDANILVTHVHYACSRKNG